MTGIQWLAWSSLATLIYWPGRLLEEDLVLWRVAGQTVAWQDLCAHRGTRLSLGKTDGDTLACRYHGWLYNPEGRCVGIPAHPAQTPPKRARVRSYKVRERYGLVWVTVGEPECDIPVFPEWDDDSFMQILCGPYRNIPASAPRIVENFLDIAHLPVVHGGILGDLGRPEIADYHAKISADGVTSGKIKIFSPRFSENEGETVFYTFSAFRPLTAHFVLETRRENLAMMLVVTPHGEFESTAYMLAAHPAGGDVSAHEIRKQHAIIFGQDEPILTSLRPELLPLDLQSELHLPSDRMAVAYRRWLNDLGLSFGTS